MKNLLGALKCVKDVKTNQMLYHIFMAPIVSILDYWSNVTVSVIFKNLYHHMFQVESQKVDVNPDRVWLKPCCLWSSFMPTKVKALWPCHCCKLCVQVLPILYCYTQPWRFVIRQKMGLVGLPFRRHPARNSAATLDKLAVTVQFGDYQKMRENCIGLAKK